MNSNLKRHIEEEDQNRFAIGQGLFFLQVYKTKKRILFYWSEFQSRQLIQ